MRHDVVHQLGVELRDDHEGGDDNLLGLAAVHDKDGLGKGELSAVGVLCVDEYREAHGVAEGGSQDLVVYYQEQGGRVVGPDKG